MVLNKGKYKKFEKRDWKTGAVNNGAIQKTASSSSGGAREDSTEARIRQSIENDVIDNKFGFARIKGNVEKVGWLLNFHQTEILDEDKRLISGVDFYFIQDDGSRFKTTLTYRPYFYVLAKAGFEKEVQLFLTKKYGGFIIAAEVESKEDLELPNHLVGLKRKYLKLSFLNMNDLMRVRRDVLPAVRKNREREKSKTAYADMLKQSYVGDTHAEYGAKHGNIDHLENIVDIREYDVPYHMRVSIDRKLFVGVWYQVKLQVGLDFQPTITTREDIIEPADCIVLAYDIETTKLPLKFPDSAIDQIMMISYMIDGQGYLITNREIVSSDIDDFEYTPKPEFEGQFIIYNEPNEFELIKRFFDHILDVKPHIFSTYNGDFFDWPFVEARAATHGLNMLTEIGFSEKDGVYFCRPCIHMDCFNWVKRDSYLPVGSQNLKAVAKAKLRYDPVELDPEDMCRMAAEQPQVLSTYSVSDAVATYYLYMKYVHPFIFALCTIIPTDPDEILRKGSGTLCEALLMVEAFHANIIFPNKQEAILNKMTSDGHVLEQETYVGGHVEALESGVFRADILCRFKLIPEAFDELISGVENTVKHALEEEEHVDMDKVLNFAEVVEQIKAKLTILRDNPLRQEFPLIYHLDVGAMYPNIILTNRLQPSAMVDEAICAACDYNKPGVKCQREMAWTWRGDYMPATRSEFQRIQQQLEMERFPPLLPGSRMRAFHELSKDERAALEKKRLSEYCRKAYKKSHITQSDIRYQTVCQQENSFYVDTVRAFRDRRYEYKGFSKVAKKEVAEALEKGDVAEIKSAKNREVLYDSLQLAYKCILNSFYGYVMRKGARWHSMEMAGIVCHTGSNIIRKAREIIEKVGRPLELDTDGIWCVLPSSFPENFTILTSVEKKGSIKISYPNAVLNLMVKDEFTNEQYHELVNKDTLKYDIRKENSIFFEVDGPYLAMILPASKEEGKRLKKRYAVYNKDKSLAELKGFEVKRRGELHLIKNFQSSVFDAFLKGDTLESCYAAVAKVADYWLDVLYSKAQAMPDSELFELISENRSMSRKLEDYGQQKSTSISTAKRLAEFLGDQMVKDAGLSCRFIISRKPDGAPVTERAIPLAIFQAEPSVKRHFIRRWLKDNSINDFDIRTLLDWEYYIERLNGTIQKIVTIPAALQGVSNPVPRVPHPDWLHKRILEKTDVLKQRKINEIFFRVSKPAREANGDNEVDADLPNGVVDIEEIAGGSKSRIKKAVTNPKRSKRDRSPGEVDYSKSWKEILGAAPAMGDDKESIQKWLAFHKKKWEYQRSQKADRIKRLRMNEDGNDFLGREDFPVAKRTGPVGAVTIGGFLRRAQQTLLDSPWQILQVAETGQVGVFRLWALIGQELHQLKLKVPRIFYVNQKEPKPFGEGEIWRKCNRTLPRAHTVYNLYEYSLPEEVFKEASNDIFTELSTPNVEGIYESQVPLDFRILVQLGCVCSVDRVAAKKMKEIGDTFELSQLNFRSITSDFPYMDLSIVKLIYLYQHKSGNKSFFGLFFPANEKATVFTVDTVRTNLMPNLNNLYQQLRNEKLSSGENEADLPAAKYTFDIKIEKDMGQVFRQIQRLLQAYKDEKKGPTALVIQTQIRPNVWSTVVPLMNDFPVITTHVSDHESLYHVLEWQRVASRMMLKHFFRMKAVLGAMIDQARYFQSPIGNLPHDTTLFGCDLLYARSLTKQNFVLWCSPSERPDLGGKEADDNRLITEFEEYNGIIINNPGCYQSVCVELEFDGMAVNTLLQAHHVHDVEGMSSTVAFDTIQQASLEEMMGNAPGPSLASYDETALCSNAFRILRATVSSWLRDVSVHRNLMADYQLIHFYRWLRSPHSLLYDPALKKTLHNLMKKLFIQLIAEFIRLGSTIVYADFSKVIICTKKSRVEDAVGYVEYVTHSIKNKELFHSIDIKLNQCWEHLMWLDSANYGAIKGQIVEKEISTIENKVKKKIEKKIRKGNSEEDIEEVDLSSAEESEEDLEELNLSDDEVEPEIEMKWSLTNYLPDVGNCKLNFNTAIAGYIIAIHKHLTQELQSFTPGSTPVRKRGSTQTPRRAHNNPLIQNTVQFARHLIQGELAQKLFQIVQKLDKKFPHGIKLSEAQSSATYRVPHYAPAKPALEFVKAIHKVLSLDANIDSEAYKLRRNLLKLIGVGEFSDESQWTDPCMSIVLPEVICKVCIQCRDIDLCKDPHITIENDLPVWSCPGCKANYETAEIEQDLVDIVNRKLMGYVLQDLQCLKCQQVKEDNMFLYCTCAGKLKTLIDVQQMGAKLKTFRGIAKHFGMPLLLQNIEWLLKMNPQLESITVK